MICAERMVYSSAMPRRDRRGSTSDRVDIHRVPRALSSRHDPGDVAIMVVADQHLPFLRWRATP
jgi:hypothetical protein